MVSCKYCRFCEAEFTDGYGYCKIILPPWLASNNNTNFGADKLVGVDMNSTDGCDLGKYKELDAATEFLPTNPGFL